MEHHNNLVVVVAVAPQFGTHLRQLPAYKSSVFIPNFDQVSACWEIYFYYLTHSFLGPQTITRRETTSHFLTSLVNVLKLVLKYLFSLSTYLRPLPENIFSGGNMGTFP